MSTQDAAVRNLRARLGRVLTLTRVLAGRRGWAHVTWHGQGFTYTLFAVRDPVGDPASVFIAGDDSGEGLNAEPLGPVLDELREALEVQP